MAQNFTDNWQIDKNLTDNWYLQSLNQTLKYGLGGPIKRI